MLNENESALKAHLKALHRSLADTGEIDAELQMLLHQLDSDIKRLLEKRASDEPDTSSYGMAERSQQLIARFAARHPHLEPALRELGNILSSMGI